MSGECMFRIGEADYNLYDDKHKTNSKTQTRDKSVSLWTDAKKSKTSKTSTAKQVVKNDAINDYKKNLRTATAYKTQFKFYIPKNYTKYKKVLNIIKNNPNVGEQDEAKYIANMVCDLSEKYGIDSEIIVNILENESGGFIFTPKTMDPKAKTHKGVMQVDEVLVKTIYAKTEDSTNMKLPEKDRRIAYDHKYFEQDQKRIDELKKKYPTPQELYNAIKSDVALGVELGIMAYKSKLRLTKGDTIQAVKKYCGNSYTLPKDSTAARKIYPVPQYKGN